MTAFEHVTNLEEFFWRQRPYIYGTTLVVLVLSLLANIAFLKTPNTAPFIRENVITLMLMVPAIAGLLSRNRALQWLAGVTFLAVLIAFEVLLTSKLK
jgi:Ca2+/Na+ antiporter